eukprot:evm.model.scf_688.4 EVM.evm.TU.scf_688.4   scf_688:18360-22161(+)
MAHLATSSTGVALYARPGRPGLVPDEQPRRPEAAQMPKARVASGHRRRNVQAAASAAPEAVAAIAVPPMTATDLKAALLDSLLGTERGLNARGETKAEINELISQLEAQNPTPSPTEATDQLSGNWKLVYTSSPAVMALLGLSRLPFVKVGDITQSIDGPGMTVENQIQISVPFSRTSFTTTASLEVRSPKRLQVKFEKGIISTPELLEDIELPDSLSVMGQAIDLSQVKSALQPFDATLRDAVAQLGSIISQQPDLQIPIENERAQGWLLTTYLDDDTRVSRADGGSVYVLVKDVSLVEGTDALEVAEVVDAAGDAAEADVVDTTEVVDEDTIVDVPPPVDPEVLEP